MTLTSPVTALLSTKPIADVSEDTVLIISALVATSVGGVPLPVKASLDQYALNWLFDLFKALWRNSSVSGALSSKVKTVIFPPLGKALILPR